MRVGMAKMVETVAAEMADVEKVVVEMMVSVVEVAIMAAMPEGRGARPQRASSA